jgi:hypothetical protein
MKPLNYDNSPCSPTSSNCVIWQGPDLHCIKLCTGDTVSDVIANLATELCIVMEQLSITNYNLSCFNLVGCKPETFEELLQFLIDQICLQNGTALPTDSKGIDLSTLVTVAPCFIVNGITTMTLLDYVTAIGNKICNIVDQIAIINSTLNEYDIRITTLENATVPTYTLPEITVTCVLPAGSYPIDEVLDALMNDPASGYCALLSATGTPAALNSAVLKQCISNTDLRLTTGTAYSTSANWVSTWNSTNANIASSVQNLWVVVCDIYNYLTSIITVQDTNTVNLTLSPTKVLSAEIQDTGWQNLLGFDWYGPNVITQRPKVRRIGNVLYFRGIVMVPLGNTIGDTPIIWDYQAPSINTYVALTSVKPAETGAGSVVINTGGSITFNQGNSVIPTNVLPAGINLDDSYSFNWEMGWRNIRMTSVPSGSTTSILTTLYRPIISFDKKLTFQLVQDIEESATSSSLGIYGTSLANNLISNVQLGEYVPFYRDATSVMNSSPASGLQNVRLQYGVEPVSGDIFTFPFTCQASDANQVGGFGNIRLDSYTACIDRCSVSIPTPTGCP